MKILIDPGHGPGNVNGGSQGYLEHLGMWKLSCYLMNELQRCGVTVELSRGPNDDPSLASRGGKAKGCNVFVSEHSNAGGNGKARGVECFYSLRQPGNRELAAKLSGACAAIMGSPDRGPKTRESEIVKGYDYLGVIRAAAATGCPHVFLIESGFHDNPEDEAWLLREENLKLLAETQARVLCEHFTIECGGTAQEPQENRAVQEHITTGRQAIEYLAQAGRINAPDYWLNKLDEVKYLSDVFIGWSRDCN